MAKEKKTKIKAFVRAIKNAKGWFLAFGVYSDQTGDLIQRFDIPSNRKTWALVYLAACQYRDMVNRGF